MRATIWTSVRSILAASARRDRFCTAPAQPGAVSFRLHPCQRRICAVGHRPDRPLPSAMRFTGHPRHRRAVGISDDVARRARLRGHGAYIRGSGQDRRITIGHRSTAWITGYETDAATRPIHRRSPLNRFPGTKPSDRQLAMQFGQTSAVVPKDPCDKEFSVKKRIAAFPFDRFAKALKSIACRPCRILGFRRSGT